MNTQPQRDIEAGPDYRGGVIEKKKRNSTAWKGEYEKMRLRFTVVGIIAGLLAVAVVVLLLK